MEELSNLAQIVPAISIRSEEMVLTAKGWSNPKRDEKWER